MSKGKYEKEHVLAGIQALFEQGQVVELRVPKAGKLGTISGYFNDFGKLAKALAELSGEFEGIYYTLNPVSPDLLSRANNRWVDHAKATTTDSAGEVLRRRWLLLDCDPKRPTGISSSDAEKKAAKIFAAQIKSYLREVGWPEPIACDSGNGYHLLYSIDLPNDAPSRDLCQKALQALAQKFDTTQVQLDQKVFNSSRIVKAYGTMARKGDNTDERPWRIARMFAPPAEAAPVSAVQLTALAGSPKPAGAKPAAAPAAPEGDWTEEMVQDAYAQAGIDARGPLPWQGQMKPDGTMPTGSKWQHDCLNCPDEHKCPDSFTVLSNGWVSCTCSHNTCAGGLNTGKWARKLEEICGERLKNRPVFELGDFAEDADAADAGEDAALGRAAHAEGVGGIGKLREDCHNSRAQGTDLPQGRRPPGEEISTRTKLKMVRGDQIGIVPVEWLWDKRIPLGKITLLHGGGGIGKSQAAIDIAARVTRGLDWPDGAKNPHGPKAVIVAASEDDWSDTGAPRFVAAGADMAKWYALQGVEETDNAEGEWKASETAFRLSDHMGTLRARLEKHPGKVALILFDPLVSFYGGKKANVEDEIRPVLEQLQKFAADCRVAVIGIAHHAKRGDVTSAVQKIAGSVALGNVTRSAWMFTPDEEDKKCFLMVRSKGNIAEDVGGLKARIESMELPLADGRTASTSRIEWLGKVEGDADDAMARSREQQGQRKEGKAGDCAKWLEARLGGGAVDSDTLVEEGQAFKFSRSTMFRVKKELGIKAFQRNCQWHWRMAEEPQITEQEVM